MRFALLLGLFSAVQAFLHENFNGIVDGNTCTASAAPSGTSSLLFQVPTNTSVGPIGIRQIAFQTIGTGYTFPGSVLLNGVTGTYINSCCASFSCDAGTYAANEGALSGECGLTWCGGEENRWVHADFMSTSLYTDGLGQNETANLTFTVPIPLADDGLGNPVYSLSYVLVPPSQSPSSSPSPSRTQTGSMSPTPSSSASPSSTLSVSPSTSGSETESPSNTLSVSPSQSGSESGSPSSTLSVTPSQSGSESGSPSSTLSVTPSQSGSETGSPSSTLSVTQSRTASESISSSNTPSQTATGSESPSSSRSSSQTPSQSATGSETPSYTRTSSSTLSVAPSPSITASESGTRPVASTSSSGTRSPSRSPSGICYSVATQYGTIISLSGGWILVNTGIEVTQAYGSGYISMGTFAGCSTVGSTCRCSYTQGSTVAGCGGKRNSYITYSYGATTDITYTNESPTCSYNFAGTIAIPPSLTVTPTLTRTLSRSISRSVTLSPSFSSSYSQTRTGSRSSSRSGTPTSSESPSTSESPSSTPTSSQTGTGSGSTSVSPSLTRSETLSPSESPSSTPTPSQTQTGSGSSTGSSSLSPSLSLSESSSETSTPTSSPTQTESGSVTGSLSPTASRTSSETGSQSREPSRTSTMTQSISDSPSFSPSMIYSTPTSTPLIYCIPYPSSTPTAESTPTSTPLYFMTRYPSNATASASTSPFFMMIPYVSSSPSSAPAPNQTLVTPPLDITGIAIGSTVIGLAGIGGLLALLHYMRPCLEKAKDHKNQSQEPDVVIVQPDPYDKLAHICVDPADLLEITQFLQSLKKEFIVIEPRYTVKNLITPPSFGGGGKLES